MTHDSVIFFHLLFVLNTRSVRRIAATFKSRYGKLHTSCFRPPVRAVGSIRLLYRPFASRCLHGCSQLCECPLKQPVRTFKSVLQPVPVLFRQNVSLGSTSPITQYAPFVFFKDHITMSKGISKVHDVLERLLEVSFVAAFKQGLIVHDINN